MRSLKQMWDDTMANWAAQKQQRALNSDLNDAIGKQDLDGVKAALDNGAQAGAGTFRCIFEGNGEIMQTLLDEGADPNRVFYFGDGFGPVEEKSALYLAIENGKADMAMTLASHPDTKLSKGGKSSYSDFSGVSTEKTYPSPIDLAREKGMDSVVETLATRMAAELKQEARQIKTKRGLQ